MRLLSVGFLVAAAAGCVGTSVGNPPGMDSTEVQLGVVGSIDAKKLAHVASGEVTITDAWISLADIGLQDAGLCAKSAGPVDYVGPIAANLLTGEVLPEPPTWERSATERYCEMRVDARRADAVIDGAPADLVEYGVFMRGTRADGTPFELRADIDAELRIGATSNADFALEPGAVGLLLTFDFNQWINASLLNQAVVKNGVIHADKIENKSVADSAKQQIPGSARLMRDKNRDGQLDGGDSAL